MGAIPHHETMRFLFFILIFPIFQGCASITGSTGQSITVTTKDKGKPVIGANCELVNSRGKWTLTTPGTTEIRRSNEDLIVACQKSGHEPGRAAVVSDTKAAMFGNILIGGGVGALLDHNSGVAYEYPALVDIFMGDSIKITSATNSANPSTNTVSPSSSDSKINKVEISQTSFDSIFLNNATLKCNQLGLKPETDKFDRCVKNFTK